VVSGKNSFCCGTGDGEFRLCYQLCCVTCIRVIALKGVNDESLSLAYAIKMRDFCGNISRQSSVFFEASFVQRFEKPIQLLRRVGFGIRKQC